MGGPFEKVVYARTNGIPSSMTLTFRGSVIPRPFDITEKYPLEFGRLRIDNNFLVFGESFMGEIDSSEFKLFNQSDRDVYISSVMNVPEYINFEVPYLRIKPKEETIIKAKFHTKAAQKWGEKNYVFYNLNVLKVREIRMPLCFLVLLIQIYQLRVRLFIKKKRVILDIKMWSMDIYIITL